MIDERSRAGAAIIVLAATLAARAHARARPLPTLVDYTQGASILVEAMARAVSSGDRAALERLLEPGAPAIEATVRASPEFESPSGLRVVRLKTGTERSGEAADASMPGAAPMPGPTSALAALLALHARFASVERCDARVADCEVEGTRCRLRVHARIEGTEGGAFRRREEIWWDWELRRRAAGTGDWAIASLRETQRTIVTSAAPLFRSIVPYEGEGFWIPSTRRPNERRNVAAPGEHDAGGVAIVDPPGAGLKATIIVATTEEPRLARWTAGGVLSGFEALVVGGQEHEQLERAPRERPSPEPRGLLAADFDSDGTAELVMTYDKGEVRLLRVKGAAEAKATESGAEASSGQVALKAWSFGGAQGFEDVSLSSGVGGASGAWRSAVALDADGDGRLDLYLVQYGDGAGTGPLLSGRNGGPNRFLRNVTERGGPLRFEDVTRSSGTGDTGRGLAASSADYDGDGRPDLYVANDFGRNVLYRNVTKPGGPLRFEDVSRRTGVEDAGFGMDVSWGDYDGDGGLDLYVSNYWFDESWIITSDLFPLPDFPLSKLLGPMAKKRLHGYARGNSLFRNDLRTTGRFTRVSDAAGVFDGGWAWGSTWTDVDGDGRPDLVVANGMLLGRAGRDRQVDFWSATSAGWRDFSRGNWTLDFGEDGITGPQPERLFLNLGDGTFADVAWASGFDTTADLRGIVAADVTGDGVPDLVGAAFLAPPVVYENLNAGAPARLSVRLTGSASNREAVGAVVRVTAGGRTQTQQVAAGQSFLSDPGRTLSFGLGHGLGRAAPIDRIEVRWPSGKTTRVERPAPTAGGLEIREP